MPTDDAVCVSNAIAELLNDTRCSVVGVGVDVVDVSRVAQDLTCDRLRRRFFTPNEAAQAATCEQVAGRFAAKEAVWKALGLGLGASAFTDVEVIVHRNGVVCTLSGAAERRARERGIAAVLVSWAHDRGEAVAVALAVSEMRAA